MSLLADALQPFIVRELANVAGRMQLMSLPDVITSPTAAFDLSFDETEQSILVEFRDASALAVALAADCCRLSSASFQTMSLAVDEMLNRDNTAWSLVKLYYAAFYAGNALIRLFGESCSYFDRPHVARLTEISSALGRVPRFRIEGGLYRCVVTQASTGLRCTRARHGVGGAHESFWHIFGTRMQRIAEEILLGALTRADAQAAFAQLEEFRDMIQRGIGHSWLSVMRNDMQYRHQFKVWFPAQIKARDRQILSRLSSAWCSDPMRIDLSVRRVGFLGEFVACCVFVVSLCHTVLARIADRSSVGARSFVQLGPMAFLNDTRPRGGPLVRPT